MKRAHVEIHSETKLVYEWVCPDCMVKTAIDADEEDRCRQTIRCRSCGIILFRQGPGEYGTERPA